MSSPEHSRSLRVLQVHNFYLEPGGEDQVFAAEGRLLEEHGDEVIRYTIHNDQVRKLSPIALAGTMIWNRTAYTELRAIIRDNRTDILHVHNTFPLLSPSVYAAARDEGVPVVQTLHNFRLFCANSFLFREGAVCEKCLMHRSMWPAITNRCYRDSMLASTAVVAMLQFHRLRKTYGNLAGLYIALTEFGKRKFVEAGLPAEKIVVKPNFTKNAVPKKVNGDFALFIGRLSPEKGLTTLLAAWQLRDDMPPLRIVGDGPLGEQVRAAAAITPRVEYLGPLPHADTVEHLQGARFLVFPSLWYEAFGLVIAEAYAAGVPVVGSKLGAPGSLIIDGITGLHFRAGDAADLARVVAWAWTHPTELSAMGGAARREYLDLYSPEKNYQQLRRIYCLATERGRKCQAEV